MRAIQIERFGGPDVMRLVDVPEPEPGAGQVRVRHRAIGLNFTDVYARTGLYPAPLPARLGVEGAGVIDAVGAGVTELAAGDRVAYAARGAGSYADARVLDAALVAKLPDSIDFARAAAMMLKGMTVDFLLRRTRTGLSPGDSLLWHAAAGGVGSIACQWAKALGYLVIGTAGSAAKCELARAHGAAHAIDYSCEDVVACVRELTSGRGVPVVYDSVGKDTWERSLDCLAPFGLMVSFGNASGPVPPVPLLSLMQKGSLYVTRPTLGTHLAQPGAARAMAGELFDMVTSGRVRIDAPREYPLADAARAHADLEARRTTGQTVLIP
ncbi:MAG TPA: quinone oxidoreductase [Kofleriaceae bacterium]|jgi:NADPH2:quinone reductase